MRIQKRYRLKLEHDMTWTLLDVFTGTPVRFGNDLAFGLPEGKAFDLAAQLNEIEERRINLKEPDR